MKTIYDGLYEICAPRAKHTVWVFSDLQQGRYEVAKRCMELSVSDYKSFGAPADMIFYLGDSTQGTNPTELKRMVDMQENALGSLGIPLCYATGNHDYDYAEYCYQNHIPDFHMFFYEMVQRHPGWYTTRDMEETWFKVPLGNYMIYFVCDHVAHDNSWCSTHNAFRYGKELYPYTEKDFAKIREDMEACDKPHIITAAHCAFPGGNRDTYLTGLIQPLPLNVRLHLYGHSHVGEYRCPRERVFSQIQWVDWQDVPQVDVSSLEDVRGSFCRSVIMQIYEDDSIGLFFRDHNNHRFVQAYFPKMFSSEIPGAYALRETLADWDLGMTPKEFMRVKGNT